ncbi:glycosyltransferase family 2 protein [Agarilytica rhodophyticola]|uniref:glycosyltransferase family 2 protein n=1 Tax=Agarilytica rhodophyticola TaxID=1737490 RepID=UPI000B34701F|nr:glycosyltransferase family 2 protein [Agarilytica rhodophyticola]
MNNKTLSILVPMYNEAEVIPVFFESIQKVLETLDINWEIICVNDGSSDLTLPMLESVCASEPRIKLVSFSRNFGKEPAMTAALDYASGDAVIPIDADLQDPPEIIGEMIAKWHEGYDVVYAKRASRDTDSVIKRNTAHWFYSLFNKVSDIPIPENVGDFRLMDRRVVDVIKSLPEKDRFMKGLFSWPGFKTTTIEFIRQSRESGTSKFNYWKLWNFALSGITSFSTAPIRVGTYLGSIIAGFSFIFGIFIIVKTLYTGIDTPGYASLAVIVLFLGGVQLMCIGLLGEYIGRIYMEVKNRPLYVVDKTIGFDSSLEETI